MPANSDQLLPNESLGADQFLTSLNGGFTFVYQGDGNLVLYKNYRYQSRKPIWASNTAGSSVGSCDMQGDGNLVIYDSGRNPVWASNTDGNLGSRLVVQDDGNVVIYRPDNAPIWATNTVHHFFPTSPPWNHAVGYEMRLAEFLYPDESLRSADGRFDFVYQSDGNLVLYRNRDRAPLWASGISGQSAGFCLLTNNSLLVSNCQGIGYWVSDPTLSHQGQQRLIVQDDGNVVIYDVNGVAVWTTNTLQ